MELKEFVKSVLKDVVDAVEETTKESSREMYLVNNTGSRSIEFDIAVTVEGSDSREGGAGIKVFQLIEGGGKISSETKNSTVSRIQFGVFVDTQTKTEREQQEIFYKNNNNNSNNYI